MLAAAIKADSTLSQTDHNNMFLEKQSVSLYLYHTIAYLLVVKRQCLLMSGDVELNPGPLDQGWPLKLLLY
jgi:hypothetical protein